MNKKIKRIVFLAGFTSISFCSLLSFKQSKYEKDVNNHSYVENDHDGIIVAHRGFSSLEVENSIPAIEKAFKSDCIDEIELDVRLTKDNEVVLSHNEYICGVGKVSKKTLEELENKEYKSSAIFKYKSLKDSLLSLDSKLSFNRYNKTKNNYEEIVSLKSVLSIMFDEDKTLLIDIKFCEKTKYILMDKINEELQNYDGNIIIQSLDIDSLNEMKQKYPNYEYQYLIDKKEDFEYLNDNINRVAFKSSIVSKKLINEEIKKGRIISIWTINSYNEYLELQKKLGNEILNNICIITDYPDEICYLRNNKFKKLKNSN